MKIYRCDFFDSFEGVQVTWHASKADAAKNLRYLQKARGTLANGPEGISAEEIPTDKAGLIDWLNDNLNTDNG